MKTCRHLPSCWLLVCITANNCDARWGVSCVMRVSCVLMGPVLQAVLSDYADKLR